MPSGKARRDERFPSIADYGFLSDCEVNCLVAPDSAVEWLCLPRPDSPSVFGAMLDRRAGSFHFAPANASVPHDRRYVPGTMVLETTWHTPTGWLVVKDVLVMGAASLGSRRADVRRAPEDTVAAGTLLRLATCIDGRVEVMVDCIPNFDYGTVPATFEYAGEGYGVLTARPARGEPVLTLESNVRLGIIGQRCMGRTTLDQGQSSFVALRWGDQAIETVEAAEAAVAATAKSWRDWLSTAKVPDHPWRSYIERSALTLKGLSFAPTGAIMAAATTSLPETPGGARNWDYRYTWIRDSSFMLRSLYRLGFDWEALNFFAFVLEAVAGSDPGSDGSPSLQIMYGIGGERDLTERTLDHLTGWRDSRPVRIGNGAFDQLQLDVWGLLLDAVVIQTTRTDLQLAGPGWEIVASLVDQAMEHRHDTDQGIWEVRGEPQHFTASKVMCWVALDRGIRLAHERGEDDRASAVAERGRGDQGRGVGQGGVSRAGCSASTTTPRTSTRRFSSSR